MQAEPARQGSKLLARSVNAEYLDIVGLTMNLLQVGDMVRFRYGDEVGRNIHGSQQFGDCVMTMN